MKIYHNPRCAKSRQTLALLQENGVEPEIVLYLKTTPTVEALKSLVSKLGIRPLQLIRKGEPAWKENFKEKDLSDDEILSAMVAYPKLIERPIVVKGQKAVLGRPPENVLEFI